MPLELVILEGGEEHSVLSTHHCPTGRSKKDNGYCSHSTWSLWVQHSNCPILNLLGGF